MLILQNDVNWSVQTVAPPGFCNGGKVRYGSIGDLEYEVPQSRLYCLCINVALCSTALQCICRDTKKFHDNESTHILHNFWTSTHRGEASPLPPLAAPLSSDSQVGCTLWSLLFVLSLAVHYKWAFSWPFAIMHYWCWCWPCSVQSRLYVTFEYPSVCPIYWQQHAAGLLLSTLWVGDIDW